MRPARYPAPPPVAIVWGKDDVLFGEQVLARWQQVFPHASVHRLPDTGHFVSEDAPHEVLSHLRTSCRSASGSSSQSPSMLRLGFQCEVVGDKGGGGLVR